MKTYSDIEIISGSIKGDSGCQEQLFYRYSELLYATCLRYMGNEHDAKDVVQDSFIRVFKYIHQFDQNRGQLKSWMAKIAINECLKKLKKNKELLSLESIIEMTSQQDIESDLNYDEIFNKIMRLPLPYRTVVNLFMVEGYSHKEIAVMMGVKESSSRSILSRAKKMLIENIVIEKKKESWLI